MKQKLKQILKTKTGIIILSIILVVGIVTITNAIIKGVNETVAFINNPIPAYAMTKVNVPTKFEKEYRYNAQVPEEVILAELYTLADRFNLDANKWEALVRCEATPNGSIDNLAKNNASTALGVSQYLIRTWEATESFKQFKKARTDYKASLWEMALDLSTGEQDKWSECNNILGIYNYKK